MKSNIKYTKKIFDYPKNKDGFMGRENRRYWIVNLKTGKKKRITEAQYGSLLSINFPFIEFTDDMVPPKI